MKSIELPTPTAMSATRRAAEITSILASAIIRTQLAENEAHRAKQPARPARSYNSLSNGEVEMNEQKISAAVSVAAQIAALPALPTTELWTLWDRYYPRRPENPNRSYLESRIAYKLQEEAFGGLSPDTRLRLSNIGIRHSKIKERRKQRDIHLAPGTVLVREWGERDHKASVTAEGTFEYEGRFFKSLSSVARHIAGSPWSGPAFFGLRKHGEGFE